MGRSGTEGDSPLLLLPLEQPQVRVALSWLICGDGSKCAAVIGPVENFKPTRGGLRGWSQHMQYNELKGQRGLKIKAKSFLNESSTTTWKTETFCRRHGADCLLVRWTTD